mgnify:CR=1 FL=1
MPKSLELRLIVALTALVILVEAVFALYNVQIQERQLLSGLVLGADQLSRGIAAATWHSMLADHRESAYQIMQTIASKQGIDRIRIFNKEGRVMFSTAHEPLAQVDKNAEACFLCHARERPLVRVDVPSRSRIFRGADGDRKMGMVTAIYNEPACSGASCHAHPASRSVLGVLDVTLDLAPVDRELAGLKLRELATTLVEMVLIALFAVFFTRRFVGRPIGRLIEGTRAVSEMDLEKPISEDAPGDVGALARSFNAMRERLKEAVRKNAEFTQSLESMVEERTAQLRAAQRELAHRERLASLGRLAASVAHEINNPVSGVLNLSMLMQRILREDGIPKDRVEEFRGYLSQVSHETSRVGRIVSDLLSFSRKARGEPGPADLGEIVRRTLSLVSHKLDLAGVRLETEIADSLPSLLCDASQIEQVVTNLVLNGAEATPRGGLLRVEVRRDGDSLLLEVGDTGSGIREEDLPRIFDPFFTTKESGGGVGLGLAVVYGIVEAHGGTIQVDSAVGRGTTFRVRLPMPPGHAREAASSAGGAS